MKGTWNYDLMNLLREAKLGNQSALQSYLTKFKPFTVANADNSLLLTLRHFDVELSGLQKRIFNFYPAGNNFQWGISITETNDYGASETNICLPNKFNYTGLQMDGDEVSIMVEDQAQVVTNSKELFNKMSFRQDVTEAEILEAFNQLCNEQYAEEKFRKRKVKTTNPFITIPVMGMLKYNPGVGCYEGRYKNESEAFDVRVYNGSAKKLAMAIEVLNEQLPKGFYNNILPGIDEKTLARKNPGLLQHAGMPATMEAFRSGLSLKCIKFFNDLSFAVCYDDNKMFGGCTVEFYISKGGRLNHVIVDR